MTSKNDKPRKGLPRPFLLILAVGVLLVASAEMRFAAQKWQLSRGYRETSAVIAGQVEGGPGLVGYSYEVAGNTYRGSGELGRQLEAGSTVPVFYLAVNPSQSTLRHPDGSGAGLILSALVCVVISARLFYQARRAKGLKEWRADMRASRSGKTRRADGAGNLAGSLGPMLGRSFRAGTHGNSSFCICAPSLAPLARCFGFFPLNPASPLSRLATTAGNCT